MHHNSLLGGRINFIVRDRHEDDCLTSGAHNRCHGNAGCLATGPRNVHFTAAYFKNTKSYKFQNGYIRSA